jgi:outer membrane protein OmpA-like peptidoglycan-associated protein
VDNPTGGLVDSQEKVLLALSSDFNRYLTFKPEAHLILQGHADHRGTASYNKELTERRVERTRNFLLAHGVPRPTSKHDLSATKTTCLSNKSKSW